METLAEIVAAAGLRHPQELRPYHVVKRDGPTAVLTYEQAYDFLHEGQLLDQVDHPFFGTLWEEASADSFHPDREH